MKQITLKELLKDKNCNEIYEKIKDKKSTTHSYFCVKLAEEFLKRGDTISALDWIKKAAKDKNRYANYCLGYAFEFGKMSYYKSIPSSKPGMVLEELRIDVDFHLPIDINKALKYYLAGEYYSDVANIYYQGKLGKIDYISAFKYEYMECNKLSKYTPSILLANMFYNGHGCKQSYKNAFDAYKYNMTDLSNVEIENFIVCFERLYDNPLTYVEYQIALALLGHSEFFMIAGDAFENGKGIRKDERKALDLYLLASEYEIDGALERYEALKNKLHESLFSIFDKLDKHKEIEKEMAIKYNMDLNEFKSVTFSKDYENKRLIIPDDFDIYKQYKDLATFDIKAYKSQKNLSKNIIGNIIIYAEEKLKNNKELYYTAYYLVTKYYYQRNEIAVKKYPERYNRYYKKIEENKQIKEKIDQLIKYVKDIEYINSAYSKEKLFKCFINDNIAGLKIIKNIEEKKEDERLERYVSNIGTSYSSSNTNVGVDDEDEEIYFQHRETGRMYCLANDDVWDYRGKSIVDGYYGTRTGMRLRDDKIFDDFNNQIGSIDSNGKIKINR